MIGIVEFALRRRILVVALFAAGMLLGAFAFIKLNIEAYPDPVPPLVDVITQNPGQSAEEIERYVTIPLEIQLAGIPNLKAMRTVSLFGLSDIKLQFTYDYSYEEAEQKVLNRLAQVQSLPNGVRPQISPWSPVGEIVRYKLVGPSDYSAADLKVVQDWVLQRRFKAIAGVIDVTGFGGPTRAYDVTVDLGKLQSYGLTLTQLLQALNASNINVGAQTLNISEQSAVVRGVGLIRSIDDINNTVVTQQGGIPIVVADLARVESGYQPRLGIVGQDQSNDIVEGIVLMRRGQQSLPTIQRVEDEIATINASGTLPPGVRIERIYDRRELIQLTTTTVVHNLLIGIVLVFLIQWLFLGDLRSAMIVAATIPFALFSAVAVFLIRGESANLLSVGAIDFGLIVDAPVILVENIYRRLSQHAGPDVLSTGAGARSVESKLATIIEAAREVSRAILFSAGIIIVGFIPLFTLSGVEGHIFGPMARTYAYALSGALIATFVVVPALSAILLPARIDETETLIVRILRRLFEPALRFAISNRALTLGGAGALIVAAMMATRMLGLEFLPALEEGNLWVRATLPSASSLESGNDQVNRIRRFIANTPEVETVVSHQGRPDDGTDAAGFFNAEFFAPLKDQGKWRGGMSKAILTKELSGSLAAAFPGIEFNFSQYIQDNVQEAVSGVKGENSIKLYGNDLEELTGIAGKVKAVMSTIEGVTDLAVFASLGQPTVQIEIDRKQAARYGLSTGDINTTLQAAIGGQAAGDMFEPGSDRHFAIRLRLAPEYRESLAKIRNLTIGAPTAGGGTIQVPLTEVARVELVSGPAYIYREQQQRYVPIKFSVRGRDLGSTVEQAQAKVAEQVPLPAGYWTEWVGEFGNLREAVGRLAVIVPITLALIALLLYLHFSSIVDMLLTLSVIPMAMIGGIFSLALTGTPFSVSAAIGFIALFGIAVMEGVILIAYFNQLVENGAPNRTEAVIQACSIRLRPVLMTCAAAGAGLLPAAMSTGIGAQVQRPLALVVVGGILLAPVLVLVILPILIDVFSRRGLVSSQIGDASDAAVLP